MRNQSTRSKSRLAIAALAALAVMTVGCKSQSTEDAESTTTAKSTDTTVPDTRDTGVTDTTIKVGIPYLDLSAIADVVNIHHGDYVKAYTAVIDDINAKGGINGRKIEPTFAPVPPSQLDPTGADVACLKLTEDAEVFAAIGYIDGDAALCYVEQHDTPIVGGFQNTERLSRAEAPWFAVNTNTDTRTTEGIAALAKAGELDDATVAVVANSIDQKSLDLAESALDEAGVDVVDTGVFDVAAGDVEAATTQAATLSERFQAAGVDTIVTVGDSAVAMARGLARTGFHPKLVALSPDGIEAVVADESSDKAVLEGAIAITDNGRDQFNEEYFQDCLKIVEPVTGEIVQDPNTKPEGSPDYMTSVREACQYTLLFAAIAEKAGPELNNSTFRKAGEQLGAFNLPGRPGMEWSAERPDGAAPLYISRFTSDGTRMLTDEKPVS